MGDCLIGFIVVVKWKEYSLHDTSPSLGIGRWRSCADVDVDVDVNDAALKFLIAHADSMNGIVDFTIQS